jgi:hypothetical protein
MTIGHELPLYGLEPMVTEIYVYVWFWIQWLIVTGAPLQLC